MAIPQLEQCCCGCTLRTGTKIIGWYHLIKSFLMIVACVVFLVGIQHVEKQIDADDHSDKAEGLRLNLAVLKAVVIVLMLVRFLDCIMAIMLLVGAHQDKAKLVLTWVIFALITSILELALNITQMLIAMNSTQLKNGIFSFFDFLVELYFILVVYSFYREIQNPSVPSVQTDV